MTYFHIVHSFYTKQKDLLIALLEWALIAAWAMWIGFPYLNLNQDVWPAGGEFIMSLQNNYNWEMLPKCGTCFFWNGFTNGGAPSFVDLHSSWLHPISSITTILFGVFNGGKITFIASLFMAGIAQWWLGKVLKVGGIARLWGALLVVAGGHLAGRLELGSIPLAVSTAACSLVIPPALALALNGGKKNAIALGITLGLAALSGQGYLQVGLIISVVPALLYLLVNNTPEGLKINPVWKEFMAAGVLAAMISAVLLVPLIHLSPALTKYTDPSFSTVQPLQFAPLNLVIDDQGFFTAEVLGKIAYPYLYVNYIGWIPVIFALIGVLLATRHLRKLLIGIGIALTFVYLTCSGISLKWLMMLPLGQSASGLRNPSVIQGLAVPFVVGLASLGIDFLIQKEWPKLTVSLSHTDQKFGAFNITSKWIILFALMFLALKSVADFTQLFIWTSQDNGENRTQTMQALKTPEAEWVQPPFGEYFWLPAAMNNNLKIRSFFRPWGLIGEDLPLAYYEDSRVPGDVELPEYVSTIDELILLKRPDSFYASITSGQTKTPCSAISTGGIITVTCNSAASGTLKVFERAATGWTAFLDGERTSIITNPWLTVSAPSGKHHYTFHYTPWDVPLGIALSIFGWIAAVAGLLYYSKRETIQTPNPIDS